MGKWQGEMSYAIGALLYPGRGLRFRSDQRWTCSRNAFLIAHLELCHHRTLTVLAVDGWKDNNLARLQTNGASRWPCSLVCASLVTCPPSSQVHHHQIRLVAAGRTAVDPTRLGQICRSARLNVRCVHASEAHLCVSKLAEISRLFIQRSFFTVNNFDF